MKRKYKKLYSYDFDQTLCFTPDHIEGKKIWESNTGLTWPYNGWYGKSETLDSDVFYIAKNEWVYSEYLKSINDEDAYNIMATGRLAKIKDMRENIDKILDQHNMTFDEVHLNWGSETFKFKCTLFENLIDKTKCDEFIMHDDRIQHLKAFEEWATKQKCDVTIVNVINKKRKYIKNI